MQANSIVITLKNRYKSSRRDDAAPAPPARAPRPSSPARNTAPKDSLAPSRSRSRSARRSERSRSPAPISPPPAPISPCDRSPSRDKAAQAKASPSTTKSSILNVDGLEDIFARFHGELNKWLETDSSKLERSEARGAGAKESLASCADSVCDFVRGHAPQTYANLGENPKTEGFASRTLPQFFDLVEEDRHALQQTTKALGAFADRRFPNNEELTDLKKDSSPLPLVKALLRLMAEGRDEPAVVHKKPTGRRHRRGGGRGNAGDVPASKEAPPQSVSASPARGLLSPSP